MRVVLLAPPGAGKGTQGTQMSERYTVPHISSGDVFRAAVAEATSIGEEVRGYLASGDLVPDDLVVELLTPVIIRAAHEEGGFILDGFPRTLAQAEAAAKIAAEHDAAAQAAIHLEAPREVLLERLVARGQGRVDDAEATILHRLEVYETKTRPLIDYYAGRGILHTIDATPAVDEVSTAIFAVLDPLQ